MSATADRIRRWTLTRRGRVALAGAALVAAALLVAGLTGWGDPSSDVPTTEVVRGEFVDYLRLRGEVRPVRSIMVTAPIDAGDMQIVKLVRDGAAVSRGDVIAEFNPARLQQTLQEKQSELRQAEAEIEQAEAEGRLREEQDVTALAEARYNVERARLDANNEQWLPRIEAEQAKLRLADANERVREVERTVESNRTNSAAEIARREHKRDKARLEVARAERGLQKLALVAPGDGIVTLLPNFRAGSMFSSSPPVFRVGDQAWPGAPIAELPDLSSVTLAARLDETDRGRLEVGQPAVVRIDAIPDREFEGRVAEIGVVARTDFSGWPPAHNFDFEVELLESDPRLRSGMSGTVRVAAERLDGVLLVPAAAVVRKDGRTLAYVRRGRAFEPREIAIDREGEDQIVVREGLDAGDRVALRDPTGPGGRP